jgi:putative membrane protein
VPVDAAVRWACALRFLATMKHLRVLGLGLSTLLASASCAHDEHARTSDLMTVTPPARGDAPARLTAGLDNAGASAPSSTDGMTALKRTSGRSTTTTLMVVDAGPRLSNDQILQVTRTANEGPIEQAELAHARSRDGRVQKLAAMMIRDHTEAENKGEALARKEALTPQPSPTSESLESDANGAMRSLKTETGTTFDKSYVDAQVRQHQAELDVLSDQLIPASTNPELTAYLHDVKASVSMHLEHARALRRELGK